MEDHYAKRMEGLLERGVDALERLAQDPVIEMETRPPHCPHCGRINPKIRQSESEGEGAMAEIVYRFHCLGCNEIFYAIPAQWDCAGSTEAAAQLLHERAEISGFDSRQDS